MSTDTNLHALPVADVVAWRARRLVASGLDQPTAQRLANDCRFDLHQLITLVERGCPPHLAVRILAPIDEQARPC